MALESSMSCADEGLVESGVTLRTDRDGHGSRCECLMGGEDRY